MYDLEDILAVYSPVWEQFSKEEGYGEMPTGFSLVITSWILLLFIFGVGAMLYKFGIVPYDLDYAFLAMLQLKYISAALLFYPITFTIIYTPIALLLAIPVVLYKHVFKLG